MSKIITTEKFIENANCIHNNKYDYSLTIYKKATEKIKIICKVHNEIFLQIPNSHLNGSGCYKCGRKKVEDSRRLSNDEFIEKSKLIHGLKYNYDNTNYIDYFTKIKIFCALHGEFLQQPRKHLNGSGCKKCANSIKNFIELCKDKFKEYNFDYSNTYYSGMENKIKVNCLKHGIFEKRASKFYHRSQICPKCINKTSSKPEQEWLDDLKIPHTNRNYYLSIGNKTYCLDGIDFENKIIYEFNGDFFHGNPAVYKSHEINPLLKLTYGELYKKTLEKEKYILENTGYKIISIWESEYLKSKIENKI